jgi:uncharacterized protein
MRAIFLIISLLAAPFLIRSQTGNVNPNGYNIFYYDNGTKSSEGKMVNGKPDGYWKSYFTTGILKNEGNRKNFELDSIWNFYNEKGKLVKTISYL